MQMTVLRLQLLQTDEGSNRRAQKYFLCISMHVWWHAFHECFVMNIWKPPPLCSFVRKSFKFPPHERLCFCWHFLCFFWKHSVELQLLHQSVYTCSTVYICIHVYTLIYTHDGVCVYRVTSLMLLWPGGLPVYLIMSSGISYSFR